MELVYLWVEEYKNIRNQGFNFSPRFTCKYDKDKNELTIKENKDYVSIFPENINITTIVGENGSGKSTILEYISGAFNSHMQYPTITIFLLNNKLLIDFYFLNNPKILNQTLHNTKIQKFSKTTSTDGLDIFPEFQGLKNHTLIYYAFSPLDRCSLWKNYHNFEYLGILNNDRTFNQNTFYTSTIESVVDFSKTTSSDYLSSFNIKMPNEIVFIIEELNQRIIEVSHEKKNILDAVAEYFTADKAMQNSLKSLITKHYNKNRLNMREEEQQEALSNFLLIHFWLETVQSLLTNDLSKLIYEKQIENFKNSIQENNNDFIKAVKSFFTESKVDGATAHPNQNIFEFIEKFTSIAQVIMANDPKATDRLIIHLHLLVKFEAIDAKFFELFKKVKFQNPFEFWWRQDGKVIKTSSGETAILHLASKLHKVSQSKDLKENIFFMCDEIEAFLHPEWQRRYLSDLIKLIELMFNHKKVHLLLTSHSPFVLSDIPEENVIFLEKGKQVYPNIETFGANIHTLLSHAFFMKEGLMGEFAKNKINEVIDYLNGKDSPIENDDKAQRYIRIIGEPILKRQLQKMLDSKRLSEIETIKKQIADLQKKLEKHQHAQN